MSIVRLQNIAEKHIAGGFSSRDILVGDELFDDALQELLVPRGSCSIMVVGGVTFHPLREKLGADVPLHERGFGV